VSVVAPERVPREAFEIQEAVTVGSAGSIRPDGTVPIHIIRPGLGRGKGKHLYEADMLERHAPVFSGWKMYVDHLSPEAKKKAGGLPRSIKDLGGRITESYWDPDVPEDPANGWGTGAVVGLAKPTPLVRELIENDPEIIEASISATATGVRPVQRGQDTVWLVEGISPKGSVDWVTEAGAGGRVVALMESVLEEARREEGALLEEMDDGEFADYVRERRPELLGVLPSRQGGGRREPPAPDDHGGDEVTQITPEALQEALSTDDGREVLELVLAPIVEERASALFEERGEALVEARIAEERDLLREETTADADRRVQLQELLAQAQRLVQESKLPEPFQKAVLKRYTIEEGRPSTALDVIDEIDGEGNVVKEAEEILRENVQSDIAEQKELLAAANPTAVRGQGGRSATDLREANEGGTDDGKPDKEEPKTTGSELTDEMLINEANFDRDDLGPDLWKDLE
jgi:hypothetical protein